MLEDRVLENDSVSSKASNMVKKGKVAKRGLSAGVGDGRENGLRKTDRGLRARKVRRSVMRNASSEELDTFRRIWKLVRKTLEGPVSRKNRIERVRRMAERGELDQESNLDLSVEGLLGEKKKSEDPALQVRA